MRQRNRFSPEHRREVADRYVNGQSSESIWKETGHAPGTVLSWVREFGYPVRTFKESRNITQEKKLLSSDKTKKRCSACAEEKLLDQFYTNPGGTGGVYSICKECESKKAKQDYKSDPEPIKDYQKRMRKEHPERYRRHELKKHFRMTLEEHNKLFESQGRVCSGCGSPESGEASGYWHTDHDSSCCPTGSRTCGKCIRGILCRWCNLALGNAKDDPKRLRNLADYLDRYAIKKII